MLKSSSLITIIPPQQLDWTYVDDNRIGDHICYITDLTKLKNHFPDWSVSRGLDDIFDEMGRACRAR